MIYGNIDVRRLKLVLWAIMSALVFTMHFNVILMGSSTNIYTFSVISDSIRLNKINIVMFTVMGVPYLLNYYSLELLLEPQYSFIIQAKL